MKSTRDASLVWKHLKGIVCLYKPPRKSVAVVRHTIKSHLCRDLNQMKVRPPTPYVMIESELKDLPAEKTESKNVIKVIPSYADNVLVTGPRYVTEEIRGRMVHELGYKSSGLLLLGINGGCNEVKNKTFHQLVRCYQVGVRLGLETDSGWFDEGRGKAKASFKHVPPHAVTTVLASMQAAHTKCAFSLAGVLPDSQEAYELALQGTIKPKTTGGCVIYSARLLDFRLPDFTIELHTLNETEDYFLSMVELLGIKLRSAATTTSIKCVQIGNFGVEHALSSADWDLQHILKNMKLCSKLVEENSEIVPNLDEERLDVSGRNIYQDKAANN
ncbi:Hypothetical predicted protein [Cloeon dipterum]|uniref:Pseudouridine synthase II N-terminal domain-containing protein n=1 Tax=Cloeon dipterum TaxID=197152 RepID=A0A8S1D490_9INSE|nr:Hypothetical predicted protein [Cloeon dipterum]